MIKGKPNTKWYTVLLFIGDILHGWKATTSRQGKGTFRNIYFAFYFL